MNFIDQLEVEADDDIVFARVSGEVDMSNARDIGGAVADSVPNSALGVVLDLSGTTYLDSSGIQLVFDLAERLRRRQQRLALSVPSSAQIRRVLGLVEIEETVPIRTSDAAAAAAVRATE